MPESCADESLGNVMWPEECCYYGWCKSVSYICVELFICRFIFLDVCCNFWNVSTALYVALARLPAVGRSYVRHPNFIQKGPIRLASKNFECCHCNVTHVGIKTGTFQFDLITFSCNLPDWVVEENTALYKHTYSTTLLINMKLRWRCWYKLTNLVPTYVHHATFMYVEAT